MLFNSCQSGEADDVGVHGLLAYYFLTLFNVQHDMAPQERAHVIYRVCSFICVKMCLFMTVRCRNEIQHFFCAVLCAHACGWRWWSFCPALASTDQRQPVWVSNWGGWSVLAAGERQTGRASVQTATLAKSCLHHCLTSWCSPAGTEPDQPRGKSAQPC